MKKLISIILLCSTLVLFAVSYGSSSKTFAQSEDQLLGTWAEHWGKEGWDSDVDYVDTIKISMNTEGKYEMICINTTDYVYDQIERDGYDFSFRMENISDPEEKFYVVYSMILNADGNKLEGESINSREAQNYVRMEKLSN